MNCFKKKYNLIYLLCFFIHPNLVIADQCPSAEIVKERKISREYDWTIDERRSLDDVLSVENLYSIRIKNKGEFVACYYSGGKNLLRLDGAPLRKDCTINEKSGVWELSKNGEQICKEEDLNLCVYEIHCKDTESNNE